MEPMVYLESSVNNESPGVSSIQAVVPEYKLPRVSACRDYPPGCGRFSTQIADISGTSANARNYARVSANRDYPPFCGRSTSRPNFSTFIEMESPRTKTNLDEQVSSSHSKGIEKMVGDEEKMREENIKQRAVCTKVLVGGKEKHVEGKNWSKVMMDGDKCVGEVQKRSVEKEARRRSYKMNHREKLCKGSTSQHNLESDFWGSGVVSGRLFGRGLTSESEYNNSNESRRKVKEALRLFQAVCRKLLHRDEAILNKEKGTRRRVDQQAYTLVMSANKYVNKDKKIMGSVPGVEVGDEFHYRVELNLIGLHHQIQGGIDYMMDKGKILATSIVASGGYADDLDDSDVLIYVGQGGNVLNAEKKPEDQKLERGNLALKNSCEEKNPVRVIRGSESMEGKTKVLVYDGLYVGERYWQDMGPHGKMVFKFRLCRIPGQPEVAWKVLKKSKNLKKRNGFIMEDISRGKEKIPICALNTIDNEKPPAFNYITRMIYPNWCNSIHPKGCNCTDGCLDSGSCFCAVKNGGLIPYNQNGAIVIAKGLVYECGPSCKCPPSCRNRVTQHGIKFQLEIFKTEKMGWGVRSVNSIPSGSFICEYIGELLNDTEAENRVGCDEYLFDIGKNYIDNSVWDELSSLLPDDTPSSSKKGVEDNGFTIDAALYGNVGRFINHSCSPNLYAQDVLYYHEDPRIPHVMLFAMDNIPPLQELTYHYNYVIDQVHDAHGNIKRKDCYCGSAQCTGRMY